MNGDDDGTTPAGRTRAELLRVAGPAGDGVRWVGTTELAHPDVRDGGGGGGGPTDPVDTVVLDGVLEQVEDPESALRTLLENGVLTETGRLVVGVRNAAYAGVLAELLSGRASGSGTGLLDRRQRCWFTLDSLRELLEAAGYVVGEVHRVRHPAGPTPIVAGSDVSISDTESYVVLAGRSGDRSRIAELTAALAETTALAARLAGVQALIGEERGEHARLVENGRRDLVALRAENAELTAASAAAAAELAACQQAAAELRASPAYRTGEKVLRTTGPVRDAPQRIRLALGSVLRGPR